MFLWDARTFGFLYVATVSQFACVISTLETSYGIKAMIKGRQLLKGNFGFPLLIQLLFYLLFNGLRLFYFHFVLRDEAHLALGQIREFPGDLSLGIRPGYVEEESSKGILSLARYPNDMAGPT
ncbi:hypothetical protein Tco_0538101 [Tanacetum coccineum]